MTDILALQKHCTKLRKDWIAAKRALNREIAKIRRSQCSMNAMVYATPLPTDPVQRDKEYKRRYNLYYRTKNKDYYQRYLKAYAAL